MVEWVRDKTIEYSRYNNMSGEKLNKGEVSFDVWGSSSFPRYLSSPYVYYEGLLEKHVKPGMRVLDLCCGDGIHTISLALLNAEISAVDIAENSIKLARLRAQYLGLTNIEFQVADVEKLDLGERQFDVITCVGSLSYMDLARFTMQVKKHLKVGGKLICLDSFDHNPVYRLNRFMHYLNGKRSWSTLKRMPDVKSIRHFRHEFNQVEVTYFGIFSFLGPLMSKLLTPDRSKELIDVLDKRFSFFKRYSFKFVLIGTKW